MADGGVIAGYPCEICGRPSTSGVRDSRVAEVLQSGFTRSEQVGPDHYFCEEHDREPISYGQNEEVLEWLRNS
jgi:hypothetical protein